MSQGVFPGEAENTSVFRDFTDWTVPLSCLSGWLTAIEIPLSCCPAKLVRMAAVNQRLSFARVSCFLR
jgi:hypothetical protein